MTLHIATIAAVSSSIIDGISCNIPTIKTVNAATTAVAPAAPAVASAVNPVANIAIPAPAARQATPSRAIAPLTAKIAGASGPNTAPATPTIANAPAIAIRPFAIELHDMLPRVVSTGVNTRNAAAITSKAAALANMPPVNPARAENPTANANRPPTATPALPSCSHSI